MLEVEGEGPRLHACETLQGCGKLRPQTHLVILLFIQSVVIGHLLCARHQGHTDVQTLTQPLLMWCCLAGHPSAGEGCSQRGRPSAGSERGGLV